jgi:catechol 2,3-dioxygenase-like lactoylglutathione lyase family enzyme
MTQIKGFIPPTRRPNALGVHSLDNFTFSVPDLAKAQHFYDGFGLDTRAAINHFDIYTFDHSHRWGRVIEGPSKKLSYLSFGVFEDDLEPFRKRLVEMKLDLLPPPDGLETNSLWIRDLDGILIELKVADKSSPNEKSPMEIIASGPPGARGAALRGQTSMVRPRRLAHILLFVRDVLASVKFYTDILGLKLSDEAGGGIAFMHGVHGSDHHMIALAKSEAPGFHHCSWDVSSVEEIGLGAMQMAARGYEAGWGLGRHVLGSNYFHYVRDPWGSYSEYSADIDYIPVTMDWQGQSHAPENSFYLWGPTPPSDFVRNYEISE